jgi:uncharacterized protein
VGERVSRTVEISERRFAHASGALWLPDGLIILIADAHLGYGWAQRRRGELGPVRDDLTRQKLNALVDELAPLQIIFLGDVVHAPRPGAAERALIEQTLSSLAARAEVKLVRGNHDRAFARDFGKLGIPLVEEWRGNGLTAVHGDRPLMADSECVVYGHLHPSLNIEDAAGAKHRVPVFLVGPGRIVLPAFSPFAAGSETAIDETMEAYAATGTRVVHLGPVRNGRLQRARGLRTGRPSEWRRIKRQPG